MYNTFMPYIAPGELAWRINVHPDGTETSKVLTALNEQTHWRLSSGMMLSVTSELMPKLRDQYFMLGIAPLYFLFVALIFRT